jgi:restriction system protein
LAADIAECDQRLADAQGELKRAEEEGADFEGELASWRRTISENPVVRASCTLVWIGDRYAVFVDHKRLVRGGYPEEAMWTTPPMWEPDSPILGYADELLTPDRNRRHWHLDLGNVAVLAKLRGVLDGFDLLPSVVRSRLVADWALVRFGAEAYQERMGGHLTTVAPNEYRFASLAQVGPLDGAEAELVGCLLRTYCLVAHSRSGSGVDFEHPYQTLRHQFDRAYIMQCAQQIDYWAERQKQLGLASRAALRKARVERKREILASGLRFQDELASILGASGYACDVFRSKDRGIDLLTQRNGVRIGIQAKKLGKPVGTADVRSLRGAREVNRLDVVVLVSASSFTRDARKEARIHPAVPLVSLEDLLERQELGQDPLFMQRARSG